MDFLRANLAPDESWYLLWETRTRLAESFLSAYGRAEGPRCFMLAGLGAGWCSESFGLPLVAREVLCVARGDRSCRFLVAHRSRFLDLAREDWVRKPTSEFSATRLRL
ncbi:MAG: hypothetical protein DRN06_09125 [Thermoprotei archaeon]|nr:MAG: hypothetical protein DRN06_09125 [Thermoprotei archaeon]